MQDASLDAVKGMNQLGSFATDSTNVMVTTLDASTDAGVRRARLVHAKSIRRPQVSHCCLVVHILMAMQLDFKEKIDNSSAPFVPKLQTKPHATVYLNQSSLATLTRPQVSLKKSLKRSDDSQPYPNPYASELHAFEVGGYCCLTY